MPFGYAKATKVRVTNQSEALKILATMSREAIVHPRIKDTLELIVRVCNPRDEQCELEAIFNAVRHASWGGGDPEVPGLMYGVRYMHDPALFDSFTSPIKLVELGMIANRSGGAPSEDCDGISCLLACLAGRAGFTTALRAWGPAHGNDFEHVYALAGLPKNRPTQWYAMDATVERAYVGWEPPPGNVLTAYVARAG